MKNIKRKLTALALSALSAISLVGCSFLDNVKKDLDDYFDPPCTHIDENADNLCDGCGATITTNDTNDTTDTPATDTETHVCTSENDGFYCADCGNVIPAVVLDYYANDVECSAYSVASDLSCSALVGEVFKTNSTDGLLLTFQSPDGYECSVTLLNDGTLDKDGANFIDGIYTYILDVDVNTGNIFYDTMGNKMDLGDCAFFYIPADFTVQFYDETANAYVTRKFSECTVFYCAGDQLVDVSNQDEKDFVNLFAKNQIEYTTYAIDTDGSPLYSGMSCIEMLGYVYYAPSVNFFTVLSPDGAEINVYFDTSTYTFMASCGDYSGEITGESETDLPYLIKILGGQIHIYLEANMYLPISDTQTVNLVECTLSTSSMQICVPDVAIEETL